MSKESKDLYYYQPAALNKLSSELSKAFQAMEADGQKYIKSATINTIVVVDANFDKPKIEDLIFSLTLVHPNRAFLIVLDENKTEITAEFSTRCHKISKNEHICSEVIRLFSKKENLSALRSILRANFITGVQTELVLFDGIDPLETFNQFGMLSDQIIYSSEIFKERFKQIDLFLKYNNSLIDLEWVKLGVWREQVKDLFNSSLVKAYLPSLSEIKLQYSGDKISAALLAGWFIDRLSPHCQISNRKQSESGLACELKSIFGNKVTLKLEKLDGQNYSGLASVDFIFGATNQMLSIARKDLGTESQLVSQINLAEKVRVSRPFENLNYFDLLKRYFFIGESTINYRDSLNCTLKLF